MNTCLMYDLPLFDSWEELIKGFLRAAYEPQVYESIKRQGTLDFPFCTEGGYQYIAARCYYDEDVLHLDILTDRDGDSVVALTSKSDDETILAAMPAIEKAIHGSAFYGR